MAAFSSNPDYLDFFDPNDADLASFSGIVIMDKATVANTLANSGSYSKADLSTVLLRFNSDWSTKQLDISNRRFELSKGFVTIIKKSSHFQLRDLSDSDNNSISSNNNDDDSDSSDDLAALILRRKVTFKK